MQSELAHANRVATMGQLTASIAHEIKQPIATARNNACAALNFLDKSPPDVAEVREALTCIVDDTDRTKRRDETRRCLGVQTVREDRMFISARLAKDRKAYLEDF